MKIGTRVCVAFFVPLVLGSVTSSSQDTVRVGSPILKGAALAPGTTSFESYKVEQGIRTPGSRSVVTIERAVEEGLEVYRVTIFHAAAGRGDSAATTIIARQSDFALLRHKVKATHDSSVVIYSQGFLSGWVVLPDKPILLIDQTFSRPVLPLDGPAPWFLGALPLREGFHAVIPRYSMWDRKERYEELRVTGTETIERDGKKFECWKVDNGPFAMPGYRAYRWVDKDTKRIVQSVLRGRPDQPEYWSMAQ